MYWALPKMSLYHSTYTKIDFINMILICKEAVK